MITTRRRFLGTLGLAGAGLLLPRPLWSSPDDFDTVSILHTTDLHSHLLPTHSYDGVENVGGLIRCASQIALWRRQNPNSLLVDCGDVYQGTDVGVRTQGEIMIRCFNQMNYDAWVLGNHEFDWGMDPVRAALQNSDMPVLGANTLLDDGKSPWDFNVKDHPLSNVAPYILKQAGGYNIGIIGVTTPQMTFWFPDEFIEGLEAIDPIESVRRSIAELKSQGADAIILAGHMGLQRGNFANRTYELIDAFRDDVTAFLGGHTHRDVPNETVDGVVFTQASYHGINCGRLDLVFKKANRELAGVHPISVVMDASVPDDPEISSLTADDLQRSSEALRQQVGTLGQSLSIRNQRGVPSQVEWLFASAIDESLRAKGVEVDCVMHGMFWPDGDTPAGPKTVADLWKLLPYENFLVTAELSLPQLTAILEENFRERGFRSVMGLEFDTSGRVADLKITNIRRLGDKNPLPRDTRVRIGLNTFDAQSAGARLMTLREILQRPDTNRRVHRLQSREALIAFFRKRDTVTVDDFLVGGRKPTTFAFHSPTWAGRPLPC
jgi:2',3'-cyclic-nucleotide 2'-phosphodiesterase/3'-nucleotidase